ncbi:MAG: hypothetical protein H6667_01025 [Ardenticatenaceae bacterium]|nr:hypothetical protein [Ardenticatenaceae bacterium]
MATAEQTMALMLASSRHAAQAHMSVNAGEWRRSRFYEHRNCSARRWELSAGRIGRLVARPRPGIRHGVVACDPLFQKKWAGK